MLYIYIYISSCHATGTNIPDPLSTLLRIVHCFWQVLRCTSRILTKLLYEGSSWSPCFWSATLLFSLYINIYRERGKKRVCKREREREKEKEREGRESGGVREGQKIRFWQYLLWNNTMIVWRIGIIYFVFS